MPRCGWAVSVSVSVTVCMGLIRAHPVLGPSSAWLLSVVCGKPRQHDKVDEDGVSVTESEEDETVTKTETADFIGIA